MIVAADFEPSSGHLLSEVFGVALEIVEQIGAPADEVDDLDAGADHWWRQRVREEIGPTALAQQVDQGFLADCVATRGAAQRLPQRRVYDVDAAQVAKMLLGTPEEVNDDVYR